MSKEHEASQQRITALEAENATLQQQLALDAPVVAAAEGQIICEHIYDRISDMWAANDFKNDEINDARWEVDKAWKAARETLNQVVNARRKAIAKYIEKENTPID